MSSEKNVGQFLSKWLHVEPILLCIGLTLQTTVTKQNFYIAKVEQDYKNTTDENIEAKTSSLISHLVSLELGISAAMMVFFGPLSDARGRKMFLLWNLGLTSISYALFVAFHYIESSGMNVGYWYFYLAAGISGIGGGSYNFFLLCFSYVSDLSKRDPGTGLIRFNVGEAVLGAGFMFGCLFTGQVSKNFGDHWVFIISTGLGLFSFTYCFLRISDIKPESEEEKHLWRRILDLVIIPFKKRSGNKRLVVLLLAGCFILQEIPIPVEDSIFPLYTRELYNWSIDHVMYFRIILFAGYTFSQVVTFPLLIKVLHVPIMLVGCLSCINRCVYYLILGFIQKESWTYGSAAVNLISGSQAVINRSSMSHTLPQDQIGSMFAAMEVVIAAAPTAIVPLGSYIFNLTLGTQPGAWTLLQIGLLLLQYPLYLILHFVY